MARPRIFVSSTFYDMRHIRSSIEDFISRLGYEPVLSEKGRIAYDPDIPLDESCYREAAASDIFVLIIGGRYGSAATNQGIEIESNFYERYESITKKEYDAASKRDIPVYVLIEKSVFTEYETYRKNKGNSSIEYAHVDSINVFRFIEEIHAQRKNNPIHEFERHSEIEEWLKEQWAGLFHSYINRRSEQKQLASLSNRVEELASINAALQRYMEAVVSRVSDTPEEAREIISSENERIAEDKRRREFFKTKIVQQILEKGATKEEVENIFRKAQSLEQLANLIASFPNSSPTDEIVWNLKSLPESVKSINIARSYLNMPGLDFGGINKT